MIPPHLKRPTLGERVADGVASFVGSWAFIIIQSLIMAVWVAGNAAIALFSFDPYPFVFLNLFMSAEAAFSTPIILMSQNRASERDRRKAEHDYKINEDAKREIEKLMVMLERIDSGKLDQIIALVIIYNLELISHDECCFATRISTAIPLRIIEWSSQLFTRYCCMFPYLCHLRASMTRNTDSWCITHVSPFEL